MKTYHLENGRVVKTTMTAGELIEELKKYPADMPAVPTWEGVYSCFQDGGFEVVSGYHFGKPEEAEDILVIDADTFYS